MTSVCPSPSSATVSANSLNHLFEAYSQQFSSDSRQQSSERSDAGYDGQDWPWIPTRANSAGLALILDGRSVCTSTRPGRVDIHDNEGPENSSHSHHDRGRLRSHDSDSASSLTVESSLPLTDATTDHVDGGHTSSTHVDDESDGFYSEDDEDSVFDAVDDWVEDWERRSFSTKRDNSLRTKTAAKRSCPVRREKSRLLAARRLAKAACGRTTDLVKLESRAVAALAQNQASAVAQNAESQKQQSGKGTKLLPVSKNGFQVLSKLHRRQDNIASHRASSLAVNYENFGTRCAYTCSNDNGRTGPRYHTRQDELRADPVARRFAAVTTQASGDRDRLLVELQYRELTPEDYELLLQLDETIASKTAPRSVVDNLQSMPAKQWMADSLQQDSQDECTCGVCLVPFQDEDQICVLACNHAFHMDCIRSWLGSYSTYCPIDKLPAA